VSAFDIYPAVDLRAGKVVRLAQGDPARQTTFGDDPAGAAQRWLEAGAAWLHVVNLDGAFEAQDQHSQTALRAILERARQDAGDLAPRAKVQFGGGLRSLSQVAAALELGVDRVILGTAAIKDPDFSAQAVRQFGAQQVAVSIDARDSRVKLRGWLEDTPLDPLAVALQQAALGVTTLIYTDIARDGMGSGPAIDAARRLADASGLQVIVAGGVSALEHVRAARDAGLSGIIIGRALYEARFTLQEALAC